MSKKRHSSFLPPISPAAPGALYSQIVEGMKRAIGEGRLLPGEPLPSFRSLAEDLLVSLITVKRAYEELEREGIIFRKQGLGTFVAENGNERSLEIQRNQAKDLLRRAVESAAKAGLNDSEIVELTRSLIEEKENEE